MNIGNINIMIETFKRLDKAPLPEHPNKGFNMWDCDFCAPRNEYTQHNCGTAACLLGWSNLTGASFGELGLLLDDTTRGAKLYCPNPDNGCRYSYVVEPEKFTLRAAIRVLEILRDTGEVKWDEAIANPWSPNDEKPAFDKDAWLNAMIDPAANIKIPLLEGPKREVVE